MIAVFCPALRQDLSDDMLNAIALEVARGVACAICGEPLAGDGGHANVIAFRSPRSPQREIRYAHADCAPSQLIDVNALPDETVDIGSLLAAAAPGPTAGPENELPGPRLSWALSSRVGQVPSIILAVDLDELEDLPVRGKVLLQALRLEGFAGCRHLETFAAPYVARVSTAREGDTLTVHTRHGTERLGLTEDPVLRDALHLAAVQRRILLIVGVDLHLDHGALDEVERQLAFSGAIAAAVAHSDPDLARVPLWGNRRQRIARGLLAVTPTARRRRRAERRR